MSFNYFTRRLHLYLGIALIAWFFMYGITSIPFAHNTWLGKPGAVWKPRFERDYTIDVPATGELRPAAEAILRDNGLEGAFGVSRDKQGRLQIYRFDFRNATRLTYDPAAGRLKAEDRVFRWHNFLTGLHARGGFQQPGLLHKAWAVLVDVVCIALLLWIASGIYMWWHVSGHRLWGWLALLAGAGSFAAFLLGL